MADDLLLLDQPVGVHEFQEPRRRRPFVNRLTIGKLARRAGVGIDTVRFYEREGLLPTPRRTASGYRSYAPALVDRVRFIRNAKGLGFSLAEVSELLKLSASKGNRPSVKKLAQRRLADLDRKIREMTALRETLSHLVGP